jgi:PKD repeat protein
MGRSNDFFLYDSYLGVLIAFYSGRYIQLLNFKPLTMKQFLLLIILSVFSMTQLSAQLPDGTPAPPWTLTDLDGNSHTLYDYLNDGKTVIIDFSATWCGPCWNYHNTHAMRDYWDDHGPDGDNTGYVFFIEADPGTNTDCLYGLPTCVGGTQGNWVAGTPYPIIDVPNSTVPSAWQVGYYPTIYAVCPDGLVYEAGQVPATQLSAWRGSCSLEASLVSITDVDCYGNSNGAVDIDAYISTSAPLNYNWSNGNNSQDLVDVPADNYTVSVSDANRTVTLSDLIVSQPDDILIELDDIQDPLCFGDGNGFISVNSSGGTGSHTYLWSNGETTATISGLSGGTYSVITTDATGCEQEESFEIAEPPVLTYEIEVINSNCNQQDGAIIVTAEGGTPSYIFDIGSGPSSSGEFEFLLSGTYGVEIEDANGCSEFEQVEIEDIPGPIVDAGDPEELDCNSLELELTAELFYNGGFVEYGWFTPNGNIVSGANEITCVVDAPGDYYVYATDIVTNCTGEDFVAISAPSGLPDADTGPNQEIDCMSTEVTLEGITTFTGPNAEYEWTTIGGNIVSGANTLNPVVNAAGEYIFTVVNTENGCAAFASLEVTINTNVPTSNAGATSQLTCTIPTITLDGTGSSTGTEFTYLWTTGDGNIVSGANTLTPEVNAAGTYTLTVTNTTNNCTAISTVVITSYLNYADAVFTHSALQAEVTFTDNSTGANITWAWDFGDGNTSTEQNPVHTYAAAGTYNVCLTVNNECGDSEECEEVTITFGMGSSGTATNLTCALSDDGAIDLEVAGGVAPYTFVWTGPNGFTSTDEDLTNLVPGTYTVVVTDSQGTTSTNTFEITAPAALAFGTETVANVDCFGNENGQIDVSVLGGTPGYSYAWSNGATTTSISDLAAGEYTIVVTDDNGCEMSSTYEVEQPDQLEVHQIEIINATNGEPNGSVSFDVVGGVAPYSYLYNGEVYEDNPFVNLEAGTYSLTIIDANECEIPAGPFEVLNVTGTNELENLNAFTAYPIPAMESVNINLIFSEIEIGQIHLLDISGKIIEVSEFNGSEVNKSFDTSRLSPGVYMLGVRTEEGVAMKRIIKQ